MNPPVHPIEWYCYFLFWRPQQTEQQSEWWIIDINHKNIKRQIQSFAGYMIYCCNLVCANWIHDLDKLISFTLLKWKFFHIEGFDQKDQKSLVSIKLVSRPSIVIIWKRSLIMLWSVIFQKHIEFFYYNIFCPIFQFK